MTFGYLKTDRWYFTCIFLFSSLCSFFKINSFDIFWHLVAGKHMINSATIIDQNVFSWTAPLHNWVPTYWLFEVMVKAVHSLFGLTGLIIMKSILIGIFFVLLACFALKKYPLFPKLFLSLILIGFFEASYFRFVLRPHIFTFLGLALVFCNHDFKILKSRLFICILFLVWSNLHAGVIFGIFLYCVLQVDLKSHFTSKKMYYISFTPILFSLINPTFFDFLIYLIDHLHMKRVLSLSEFEQLKIHTHAKYLFIISFHVLIPAFTLCFLRKLRFLHIALFSASAFLLTKGVRFIPDVLCLLWPVTLEGFYFIFSRSNLALFRNQWLAMCMPLCYFLWLTQIQFKSSQGNYIFGAGLTSHLYPIECLTRFSPILLKSGRIYNSFSTGGYILYHFEGRLKVFQDGRIHAYPESFHTDQSKAKTSEHAWISFINDWNIEYALFDTTEDPGYLVDWLIQNKWQLLYENEHFSLVSRPPL